MVAGLEILPDARARRFANIFRNAPESVLRNCVLAWHPRMGTYATLGPKYGYQRLGGTYSNPSGKYIYDRWAGVIRNFPAGVMPITGAQEPARTNYALRSGEIDNTGVWGDQSAGTSTVTANAAVAPDGTITATKLQGNNVNTWWGQSLGTGWENQTVTLSIWLRCDGAASGVNLRIYVVGTTNEALSVTLTNQWQRFSYTVALGAGDTSTFIPALNHANGNTVYAWGAQVEIGAYATSYIPTTTATVARSADAFRFTNAALINPLRDKCSVLCVGALPVANSESGSAFSYGTLNNSANAYKDSLEFRADETGGGYVHAVEYDASGGGSFQIAAAKVLAAGEIFAHLVTREVAGPSMSSYCNGSLLGSTASGTPATTFDRLEIGGHWSGGARCGANSYLVALFDRVLTAAEAKALTLNPERYVAQAA